MGRIVTSHCRGRVARGALDPAGLGLSSRVSRDPWRSVYSKADLADALAVARHACRDAGELELVGICSGSWYAAHVARRIGAQSAILVNQRPWNWRITPTWLGQWDARRKALQVTADSDAGANPPGSRTARLKALLNAPREPLKSVIHNYLPRHVLRLLAWVGLLWLPENVLTPLARCGIGVTVIASPEDAEQFTARGGRATLDRLREMPRPPRLIATPVGDHSAYHPAILAAIRNAVLPGAAASASQYPSTARPVGCESPSPMVPGVRRNSGRP